jgi:solute carrier family 45 protein 1/2/4
MICYRSVLIHTAVHNVRPSVPLQVLMIGFSADLGRRFGDTKEHCGTATGSRWAAAAVYIVGFWFLDFANNTVQGPARAMMADLSGTYV